MIRPQPVPLSAPFVTPTSIIWVWYMWFTQIDLRTCPTCYTRHGDLVSYDYVHDSENSHTLPPLHEHCRCTLREQRFTIPRQIAKRNPFLEEIIDLLKGIFSGRFIDTITTHVRGWLPRRAQATYLPGGRSIGGDIFENRAGKLPDAPGRVWREADVNDTPQSRGGHRIVVSNDGLAFVTFDHYMTFVPVALEEEPDAHR
jgi:hypothetical protein